MKTFTIIANASEIPHMKDILPLFNLTFVNQELFDENENGDETFRVTLKSSRKLEPEEVPITFYSLGLFTQKFKQTNKIEHGSII